MSYMRLESVMEELRGLVKEINTLVKIQNNQGDILNNLLNKGLVFEKKVSKFGKTSGAMFMPKRLVGQYFKVLLIPTEDLYDDPRILHNERKIFRGSGESKILEDPDKLSRIPGIPGIPKAKEIKEVKEIKEEVKNEIRKLV